MNQNEDVEKDESVTEEDISWKEIGADFKAGLNILMDTVLGGVKKWKWESFIQEMSDRIDHDALIYEKATGKTFLGGKCRFSGEKSVLKMTVEEYFQVPSEEKIEHQTFMSEFPYSKFDQKDPETKEKLNKASVEPIMMDVEVPEHKGDAS